MQSKRLAGRTRRHRRVRKNLTVSKERPRLAVFRSNLHIYAQIVDDAEGRVLAAASDLKLENVPAADKETKKISRAKAVGRELAARAREKGIKKVAFDRGGYRYHGRVAALAEGAREGGLTL